MLQCDNGYKYKLWIDFNTLNAISWRTGCSLQRTKRFVLPSVGGATRFANLRRKFSKTQKIGCRVVSNTSYGYY